MSSQENLEDARSKIGSVEKMNKSLSEKCNSFNIFNSMNKLEATNRKNVERKFKENKFRTAEKNETIYLKQLQKSSKRKKIQRNKELAVSFNYEHFEFLHSKPFNNSKKLPCSTQNRPTFRELFTSHIDENNNVESSKTILSERNIKQEEKKQKLQKCPSSQNAYKVNHINFNFRDASKINSGRFLKEKFIGVNNESSFQCNKFPPGEINCSLLSHEKRDSTLKLCDFVQFKDKSSRAEIKNTTDYTQLEGDEKETIAKEWDFTEEPVDFAVPLLHKSKNCTFPSEEEIRSLTSKNVPIKKGKWTKHEEAILIRNVNNFRHQFEISYAGFLFDQSWSDKSEQLIVKKFLKAKHFYVRLGKDLNVRLLHDIYLKARSLFSPQHIVNKCDKKLVLLQLQKKYGYSNELIAHKIKQPVVCSNDMHKNSSYKRKCAKEEEENMSVQNKKSKLHILSQSLEEIIGEKVSVQVGTHNNGQCYVKRNYCKLDSKSKYPKWNWRYSLELLRLLSSKYFVNEETKIDWIGIYGDFKNIVPSVSYLKKKFNKIKLSGPKGLEEFHQYMIDFLLKKHEQQLENHFKKVF